MLGGTLELSHYGCSSRSDFSSRVALCLRSGIAPATHLSLHNEKNMGRGTLDGASSKALLGDIIFKKNILNGFDFYNLLDMLKMHVIAFCFQIFKKKYFVPTHPP